MNIYIEQSAVIPYRIHQERIEILLITSRKNKRWIIPKGIIELLMTPQASAAQEALEEAGVKGQVLNDLMGTYTYKKWGGTCRVRVYLLKVETVYAEWLEARFRQRQWFSLDEAIKRIQEVEISKVIMSLPSYLKNLQIENNLVI